MDTSEEKYFYIYDNKIIKKISIDAKNLNSDSNIFKYGILKFCKHFDGEVFSIISGRDAKNNYYHWIIDVLPRLIILEKQLKNKKNINLLVPAYNKPYHISSLKPFFKNCVNYISLNKNKFLSFNEIILTSNNNNYIFLNKVLLFKLKNKFIKYIKKNKISSSFKPSKIYISREDSNIFKNRSILNEKVLKKELKNRGFKIIQLSKLNFFKQILLFQNAKIIIGMHGAGLTNILFCNKKTRIVEITHKDWPNMYLKLARKLGLSYERILGKKESVNSNRIEILIKNFNKYI